MKDKMKKLFSLSVSDTEYFNDKNDKIEIVSCPLEEKKCKEHLSVVNRSHLESGIYHRDKDFQRSIETLKSAFYITTELQEPPCLKCAGLFRSTITQSLENIHGELGKMSTGLFRTKRYHASYIEAGNVLKEFKNEGQTNSLQLNEQKSQSLRNTLMSHVACL